MLVTFERNTDKTCSMTIDNVLVNIEIPYIPERCIDHRGLYLFYWCKKKGKRTEIKDFEFSKPVQNLEEIGRGFDYMKNPIFVLQAIKNFKNRI